jgi:hypothetical protein
MIWTNKKLYLILIFGLVYFNSNCVKYSFKGALPSYIKTVSIPLFEDQSRNPWFGLRELLTNAVVDGFINDNTLTVIDNENEADLLLKATITGWQEKYVAISEEQDVEQKQMWIYVKVECLNQKQNTKLWAENLSRFSPVEGAGTLEENNIAIENASMELAADILQKTIAAW